MDKPKLLWKPGKVTVTTANLTKFSNWLKKEKGLEFDGYHELWKWSVANINTFWQAIWDYFAILHSGSIVKACSDDAMPHTKWFEGAKLSYAEHIFRNAQPGTPAIISKTENSTIKELSWNELEKQVAGLRNSLVAKGIKKGDCVVGWLPNIPEAVVAFLAVNSLGAIWSGTSPDFGIQSVIDRFAQIEPKILIAADGYYYNGKTFDKTGDIQNVKNELPTITHTIIVPVLNNSEKLLQEESSFWNDNIRNISQLTFERVPFEHPIWVLYSSGTTGLPKAITHSNGGVLLEHLKYLTFHNDIKPGERFFWFSTTGWMMWNYMVASMLCGATIVLYDGSPAYPDINALWKLASEIGVSHFGTSAPFIIANMKAETTPGKSYNLDSLRSIGSTGAPLPPDGFDWIYSNVKKDLWLASISGGTDVCSAFVGGNPLWPVYSGEIQCRALGCKLEAYDEDGQPQTETVGEMVISKPMPSMPVFFWNDPDFERYNESYFEMYPGKWRHGDWTMITEREGVIIYGRSDATLNRGGIRIGTAEIYRVLDKMDEVRDGIMVCVDKKDGSFYMPLFIVSDYVLDSSLKDKIKKNIREQCTPRHVPDEIIPINEVPYTISGKKTEAPVKKILMGENIDHLLNKDALKNPDSLEFFVELAKKLD